MTETTPVIEVPHIPNTKPPKAPAALVGLFRDRRLLTFLVVLLIVTNVITPLFLVNLLYREQIILVTDNAGNLVIGPGIDFSQADKMHVMCGVLAAKALLDRNPDGFDSPELLQNVFAPSASLIAEADWKASQPSSKAKVIHQKVEIAEVKVQSIKQTSKSQLYYIGLTGQIIRMGSIDGTPIREVDEFKLQLEMARNPRLTENGRYPLVVTNYKFTRLEPTGLHRAAATEEPATPVSQPKL